jgi:predicted MFS family arabinose efflux permease
VGLIALVVLGFVVCLMGSSLKNTVQVFFVPMAQLLGETRGSFALATTVFAITYAIAAPLTGAMSDRVGPGRVLVLGTVAAGASLLLCAWVPSFAAFVVVYGVLAAFAYAMLSYVPIGVLVDRVFADGRKGFFYALLTNGTAAGFILLVPLWELLGRYTSWNAVLTGLGAFILLVITPLTALRFGSRASTKQVPVSVGRPRVGVVLSSSVFWRLGAAFFACGATMAFIDVHLIPYLGDMRMSTQSMSAIMVVLGLFELGGALVAGRLCDRSLIKAVLVGGYAIRAGAMFMIAAQPDTFRVFTFAALFGVSYMATEVATSMWVLSVFPTELKGAVMGLIWTMHQIGAALSSQFGAIAHDRFGTYLPEILAIGTVALVATAMVATMRAPTRRRADVPA